MIRPFNIKDLEHFTPNEFSQLPDFTVLTNPAFRVQSQVHADKVQAIIVFRNYWGRCWSGFLLICADYSLQCARELKRFLHDAIRDLGAQRFQTESLSHPTIKAWHEWLGFTYEGHKKKFIFDRDYDCWAIVTEGA
jgi:alkyl hydroperoxide reductase subunit AhpC